MRVTAEQLSKIDWAKFELPKHEGNPLTVDLFQVTENGPMISIRKQIKTRGDSILYRYLSNTEWQAGERLSGCSESESLRMFACGAKVDAFIAAELAAIERADRLVKRAKLPNPGEGFELCEEREANEYNAWYDTIENDSWCKGWGKMFAFRQSPTGHYAFRRPIAKPLQLTITNPPTLLQPNTIAIIDGVAYTVEKSVRDGNIETAELRRVAQTKHA